MYALTVTVNVISNEIGEFLQKTLEHALATRKENGNVRYDVLQSENNPACIVIYEVYRTKEDFLLHRKTLHTVKWKAETESMMAKPRERVRGQSVFFSD